MNNDRRKQIEALQARIEDLKAQAAEIQDDITNILGDERDSFDNMPENLQQGDKGQRAENAISSLEDAEDGMESCISGLEDAIAGLDNAAE